MDLKVCPCRFKLNYLELLGELNTNTPLCVIQEILDAHGFEHCQLNIKHHTKYVTAINSSLEATPIINIPVKDDDTITFRKLARFINSHAKWDKASLIIALSSLVIWYDKNKLLPAKDFTVGMITPQQVNNLNSVILYAICCRNKITTTKKDTIDQLSNKVKLLLYNRQALLQYAYAKITMMSNADIIALTVSSIDGNIAQTTSFATGRLELISTKLHLDNKDITTASLTSDYEQLHNIKALQKMIIPTTASRAVALSAILHQSDISSSSNPQLQYLSKGNTLLTYNDQHLSKITAINPGLLSLKRSFNPLFPVSYYSSQELTAILRRETHIIPSQLVDKYQALYLTYICENFYHGLQPEVTNKTSLIELPLSRLPNKLGK